MDRARPHGNAARTVDRPVRDQGYAALSSRFDIVATSPAVLDPECGLVRKPRMALRKRPDAFLAGFDGLTLFHDCFRAADGETVLLVGPPLRNLRKAVARAGFRVDGKMLPLAPAFHETASVSITALGDVPLTADILEIVLGDVTFTLAIQANYAERLAGRRMMFTLSLDSEAAWLSAWADYHRRFHGVDALVFFDNGSTNLSLEEIGAALAVSGITDILIVPWQHPYGPFDPGVVFNPYWALFAQISAMSDTLRRFGARASGILNCDVDELIHTMTAPDIFAQLDRTKGGLLAMRGRWIEAGPADHRFGDHRDFRFRLKDEKARQCRQRKWVLDPRRDWVADLDVHPYMHWIENRPRGAKAMPSGAFYWHFKGINTNWKTARNIASAVAVDSVEPDPEFVETLARWDG